MKIKMKMVAAAVAMVAAGAANAAWVTGGTGTGGGTLGLVVWDSVTGSYYTRDLGYTMNTFLPNTGASITGTGETGVTYDKTPNAGLTIDSSTPGANFGTDATYATWLAGVDQANVRWTVTSIDNAGVTTGVNTFRQIGAVAAGTVFTTPSNGSVSGQATLVNSFASAAPVSTTGSASAAQLGALNNNFTTAGTATGVLGGAMNLYYWVRTVGGGAQAATTAFQQAFQNDAGLARLTLTTTGNLSYVLDPANVAAVPLPAAAWLMGAGLLALGGAARRKKALAAA